MNYHLVDKISKPGNYRSVNIIQSLYSSKGLMMTVCIYLFRHNNITYFLYYANRDF